MREWEVIVTLVFTLGRREGDGHLVLQRMSALSAEPGIVAVRMSTVGTEHREPSPRSSFGLMVVVGDQPSTSMRTGNYPTRWEGSMKVLSAARPWQALTLQRGWKGPRVQCSACSANDPDALAAVRRSRAA